MGRNHRKEYSRQLQKKLVTSVGNMSANDLMIINTFFLRAKFQQNMNASSLNHWLLIDYVIA